MSDMVARAREVLGVRFQLHGRVPATGLDCVGLVAWAAGRSLGVPTGYRMRGGSAEGYAAMLAGAGLVAVPDARAGDVLLCVSGPGQFHLGIATDMGMIHADAGLGRVVERPGAAPWPVVSRWRLADCPMPVCPELACPRAGGGRGVVLRGFDPHRQKHHRHSREGGNPASLRASAKAAGPPPARG